MKKNDMSIFDYIISILLDNSEIFTKQIVSYGKDQDLPLNTRIVIIQSDFFDEGVYCTERSLPQTPFCLLPDSNIPFLFGVSKIEHKCFNNGQNIVVLYADLVASTYYLLSRYEEIIKTECRDQFGRFLAKDSIVFQQGYGLRPLVDEWGRYLRNLLRENDIIIPEERKGFRKIYLTHDVDYPFLLSSRIALFKQIIKKILNYKVLFPHPLKTWIDFTDDSYYTFPKLIKYDSEVINTIGSDIVESIYFLIAAGNYKTKEYCNIRLKKYQKLLQELKNANALLGLHVSYEAGQNPNLIKKEMKRLKKYCEGSTTKSRHHYLRWTEPEHIDEMEAAGITEDYTLGYPDQVGFRVGTCRPYNFINPRTRRVTNVQIHPLEIMECTLADKDYMNMSYEEALKKCKEMIDIVYDQNGELDLLWHNTSFNEQRYHEKLYKNVMNYLKQKGSI